MGAKPASAQFEDATHVLVFPIGGRILGLHFALGEAPMRWLKDECDIWCEMWALQRRKILGLDAIEPRDRIGKLRSTLGSIKEERDGASQGTVAQRFPEVYIGPAPNYPLLVNRACKEMNRDWSEVIEAHYVLLFDQDDTRLKVKQKAHYLEISVRTYFDRLTYGKNFVYSFVMCSTKYARDEIEESLRTQNTLAKA